MTNDKPSDALLIARETLAVDADNRGATHTAIQYRSGAWDENGEMRTAVLVATAAIKATLIDVADACETYAGDQRAMIGRSRTKLARHECKTRAEVYEGLAAQCRDSAK